MLTRNNINNLPEDKLWQQGLVVAFGTQQQNARHFLIAAPVKMNK